MKIQKNLKRLRKKKAISQQRLSDQVGLIRSTYAGYESGVCEPNIRTLIKLSKFFDVTVDELIK